MNVTPDGPLTAPLLVIGEAPGSEEVRSGIPFYGATGQAVRGVFERMGLRCKPRNSQDVRFNNAIPHNPGTIMASQRDTLVREHWDNITHDLKHTKAKVIIACGGVALRRLTAYTNIANEHGSVIPAATLPAIVHLAQTPMALTLPTQSLILPCLHPAGIMHTKIMAEWLQCKAVLARAAEYALGKPYTPEIVGKSLRMSHIFYGASGVLEFMDVLRESSVITIDTEFNRETRIPFMVGVLGDADDMHVRWFKPEPRILEQFKRASSGKKQWVAHYHPAELASMLKVGVDLRSKDWWDTLLGYATLYPDTNVALNRTALFFLDNERNWKDLACDDPNYLAKDVRNCYRVYLAQRNEMAAAGMMDLFYDEVMPSMQLLEGMENSGLEVDTVMQDEMLTRNTARRDELLATIHTQVPISDKKVKRTVKEMKVAFLALPNDNQVTCELHLAYTGLRKKKFTDSDVCTCKLVYEHVSKLIPRETPRAFKPGNPHDLRWLLYDHWKLPVPRKAKGSKSAPTGADAIRTLTVKLELAYQNKSKRSKFYRDDAPRIVQFMLDAKEYQHLEKMDSTFLRPPVDARNIAHPPYRQWGTGTGRLAGGYDEGIASDGAASEYSFNPLNIPKETRQLFKADSVLLGE